MVDVVKLEQELINNYEAVLSIMLQLGFDEDKIKYHKAQNFISAPRPEEGADNPNGCLIYLNSLNVIYTTRSWTGNIFSLVMKERDVRFPEALKLISKWTGCETSDVKIKLPFYGFYKGIVNINSYSPLELPCYKESDLPPADSLSLKFLKDGVSGLVQEEWGIRYSHEDDAVLIPIHDYSGNLVGCKARNNDPNCDDSNRFWMYIPYSKSQIVYGWWENFQIISEKQTVVIVESEKGVLQAASFGCFIVVAVGGHNISATQARYIKMLGSKKIIVAFDEGIAEEEIIKECKKLSTNNQIYHNSVFYIYDKDHLVIPEGSKGSPTDYGIEGFKTLTSSCIQRFYEK